MAGIKELEKVRPCGRLETYSTARHHLGLYNNVGLTATYTSPSSSSESLETIIYTALKRVIAKHPVLSVIALNEDKSYPDVYFARLSSYDLRTCVEFHERKHPLPGDGEPNSELDTLLTAQHNLNFKHNLGTKPFWRLIILTSPTNPHTFTASWIFHHALSDGSSAMLFHQSFLAALNTLPSSPDTSPIVTPPTIPFPPAFEDQHPLPISWPFFLSTLSKILLPSLFARRPAGLWTSTSIPKPLVPPKFKFRTLVFSAGTSKRLANLARTNETSMTALLQCVFSHALFTILSPTECSALNFTAPMAMRRFLPNVPRDQMVVAVGQLSYTHHRSSPSTSFDWEETRKVKKAIGVELAKQSTDNSVALLRYVSNMQNYLAEQGGKEREGSVEVSNIGLWKGEGSSEDGTDEAKWKVGRLTFSQCANPVGAAICVNVVTGGSGELSLGFAWGEGVVGDDMIGAVIEGVKGLVEQLCKAEE